MKKINDLKTENHQSRFIVAIVYVFLAASFLPVLPFSLLSGAFHLSISRVCLIALLLITGLKILNRELSIPQLFRQRNNYAIIFHFIWLLYALLSIFWVKDYQAWFRSIFFLGAGVVSIVAAQKYMNSDRRIHTVLVLISVVIIVNGIIGGYEIVTGNYLFIEESRIPGYRASRYPVSWCYNTNDFATMMFVGFNICFMLIHALKNRLLKILYSIATSGMLVLILYTTSRANIYGIIISVMAVFVCALYLKKPKIIVSLILVVLVGSLVFVYARPGTLNIERYVESSKLGVSLPDHVESSKVQLSLIDESLREKEVTSSSDIRVNLLLNGFVFLKQTYGLGVGSGNTEYWMANFSVYPVGQITNMHNWWGELFTNYGIIIFIGYMIYYCRIGLFSLSEVFKSKSQKEVPYISILVISILAGFVFSLMSSSSNFSTEWLWAFFGVLSAYQNIVHHRADGRLIKTQEKE